jgi:hypothetical protein
LSGIGSRKLSASIQRLCSAAVLALSAAPPHGGGLRLGLRAKFHSKDPAVNAAMLHEPWDRYFDCAKRSGVDPAVIDELRGRYQVELLVDPFCVD